MTLTELLIVVFVTGVLKSFVFSGLGPWGIAPAAAGGFGVWFGVCVVAARYGNGRRAGPDDGQNQSG